MEEVKLEANGNKVDLIVMCKRCKGKGCRSCDNQGDVITENGTKLIKFIRDYMR